jgi:hypothetical protein
MGARDRFASRSYEKLLNLILSSFEFVMSSGWKSLRSHIVASPPPAKLTPPLVPLTTGKALWNLG